MHEEENLGHVFPGASGIAEVFAASGVLPAQTRSEDPQIPPVAAGMTAAHRDIITVTADASRTSANQDSVSSSFSQVSADDAGNCQAL